MLSRARLLFTSVLNGIVPASGGGTTNFLRADGTWNVPPGSGGGSGGLLPTYIANNFYWGLHCATAGGNLFSITIGRWTPIYIPVAMTLSALGVRINGTAAGNVALGLYANSATGRPTGAPLATTGSLSTAAAAIVTGAISYAVTVPGIYWVQTQMDNTTATLESVSASDTAIGFMVGAATAANLAGSGTVAGTSFTTTGGTFGTFTTNPAITESNNTVAFLPIPIYKIASVP